MQHDQAAPVGSHQLMLELERLAGDGVAPEAGHQGALFGQQPLGAVEVVRTGRVLRQARQCPQPAGQHDMSIGQLDLERAGAAQGLHTLQHVLVPLRPAHGILEFAHVDQRDQVGRLAAHEDAPAAHAGIEQRAVVAAAADVVGPPGHALDALAHLLLHPFPVLGRDQRDADASRQAAGGSPHHFVQRGVGEADALVLRDHEPGARLVQPGPGTLQGKLVVDRREDHG